MTAHGMWVNTSLPPVISLNGKWVNLLYARPTGFGEPGWSNRPTGEFSESWYYLPKGTGTIIVPDDATQKKILEAIRIYRNDIQKAE